MLNVVVVNAELPYPPTSGNRIRTLNLLERLASRHRITFIARAGILEETQEAAVHLENLGIRTIIVDRPVARKSGPAFYARLGVNLFSSRPYSVSSHSDGTMQRAVAAYATAHKIDLWQAESTGYIEAMAGLRGAPKIVIAHNVESLIWRRYFETEEYALKRWYIKQQWRKFEGFERRAFAEATRVVAVSDTDARLIRDEFGRGHVDVVDNGIDRAYFERVHAERDPTQILFLGSLDWRPNLDALRLLLDQIFPAVRAAEPAARLMIVGRRPPETLLRRVAGMAGVEIHGDVPDVRRFLAQSAVMAVPLRIGGGSRLKILEALACGLPVVSTRVGAEGLELVPGRDYMAADKPDTMARALAGCIRDPAPALAAAERSRQFVLARYDWDTLANKLEEVWFASLGERMLCHRS